MTKNKLYFIFLLIALGVMALPEKSSAQAYYYFGDATATSGGSNSTTDQYGSIFANTRDSRKTQHIYTGAQLQSTGMTAGNITGLAFYCTSVPGGSGYTFQNVELKFGMTTAGGTASYSGTNLSNFSGSGLTTVFTGNVTVSSTGWVHYTFNQPVYWDGTSNLQVQFCSHQTNNSSNGGMAYEPGYNQTRGRHSSSNSSSWCSQTFSYNNAYLADIRFAMPYANDAQVSEIVSPVSGACEVDSNIVVTVENGGTSTLNDVEVHWSINGVAQTALNVTGLSVASGMDTTLTVAQYTFSSGDSLSVWTEMPNNVPDSSTTNDTVTIQVFNSLNGLYAIDQTGAGDFLSFTEAVNALAQRGACGEVIFEAEDGIYPEQIDITPYITSGDSSTVTFRSASGNANNVVVQYPTGSGANNFVWKMNNLKGVTLQDFTLKRTGTSTYGCVLQLQEGGSHYMFDGMELVCDSSASQPSQVTKSGVYVDNNTSSVYDTVSFINCTFKTVTEGIYGYVNSSGRINDWLIDSCEFLGVYYNGIDIDYFNRMTIKNTLIDKFPHTASNSSYGIFLNSGEGTLNLENNQLIGRYSTRFGFRVQSHADDINLYNNKVSVGDTLINGSQSVFPIYFTNTGALNAYNNSLREIGGSSTSAAFYVVGTGISTIYNNIMLTDNGYALQAQPGNLQYCDYNSMYSSNPTMINYGGTGEFYNIWKNAYGFEANGFTVVNPFINDSTLEVCNDTLNNVGLVLSGITTDINGDLRDTIAGFDLGAEIFVALDELSIEDRELCNGTTITYDFTGVDTLIWNGTINSPVYTVTDTGTYYLYANYACGMVYDTFHIAEQEMSVMNDNAYICENAFVTTLSPGVSNASYLWSTGDTTATIDAFIPDVYSVTITGEYCVEVDSTEVGFTIPVDVADTFVCEGSSVALDAAVAGTYNWSTGATNQVILVSAAGTYGVTVTDASGCVSSDNIDVELIEQPIADFSYSRNYFIVVFQNLSQGGTSYHWDFGDGATSTEEHPVHVFPTTEDDMFYNVTLTVYNACDSAVYNGQAFVSGNTISSVDENAANAVTWNVYPNPTNGTVYMNSTMNEVQGQKVVVYNVVGELVSVENLSNVLPHTLKLDVPSGMYTVQVLSAENEVLNTSKIVVK